MLTVNANLMLRTDCLLTVNNILAAVGAALGTTVLAANAVLLQIKDLMSYLIDGMANGAAIFTGRSLGQRNAVLFRQTLRLTYKWLLLLVLVLTAGLFWGGARLIACFTELPEVAALAGQYRVYVLLYPALAGVGLALYGFFTGATHTSPVRNMMLLALAVFWSAEKFLAPRYGNDGLWMAFLLFVGTQSLVLWWLLPTLRRKIDGSAK